MAYEMKDMTGSAFKNNRRDRDTSPDMTGSALVYGKECWVNAWVKKDKNGDMFFSFTLKEKQPRQEVDTRPTTDIIDDVVPF